MKVILRSDVEKLGMAGEVKSVADGFARNYLFPRGLAMKAVPGVVQWFAKGQEKRRQVREKAGAQAKELAGKLTGVTLSFSRSVGDQGKLFGSVGKSDIVDSLKASGFAVNKNAVLLDGSIKQTGDFEVEIKLHPEAIAKIKISVQARS